jgi:hypothetical protein
MFEFLKAKYRNPTELVKYQDHIMELQSIHPKDVNGYINELNKYNVLFQSFFGANAIPENNIAIRQNLILATLYFIWGNKNTAKELKVKADNIFSHLFSRFFYLEGHSYFKYVKMAYKFYHTYTSQYFAGNVNDSTLNTMDEMYRKIANYDGSLPINETYYVDRVNPEQERIDFSNDLYSVYFLNSQSTYILISHNLHINRLSKNLHMNWDFGHVVLYNQGRKKLLHPWYPGYATKSSSDIKHTWNNNVIVGAFNSEPTWRYLPKVELSHEKKGRVHNLKMGTATRKIEVMNNGIIITDEGGSYSSYNVSEDCSFDFSGTIKETVGYDSFEAGKVQNHRRIELRGKNRMFFLAY